MCRAAGTTFPRQKYPQWEKVHIPRVTRPVLPSVREVTFRPIEQIAALLRTPLQNFTRGSTETPDEEIEKQALGVPPSDRQEGRLPHPSVVMWVTRPQGKVVMEFNLLVSG